MKKISKSHFYVKKSHCGCEVVPVCGTFGAGTPVKKSQKVTFTSKKSQNVMLYIKYKREPGEKNLKKSLFCKKKSQKVTFHLRWYLFAVYFGNRVGSSCGTFGQ